MSERSEKINFTISPELVGQRIDRVITQTMKSQDVTRSAVQKWLEEGFVLVNSKKVSKNYASRAGDSVEVQIPPPVLMQAEPEDIPLDVAYEDKDLLVVNKPKGMVVHPATGNYSGTLVNALLHYCKGQLSGINGVIRPGIVHRIDKDTSGLLIVAKNDFAHQSLAQQIKVHSFTRMYEAVVCGTLKTDSGTIDAPIGRHPVDRKKMAVTEKNSRNAITHYEVLGRYAGYTHVRLRLETGRTHQIRVHMASIGHPVAGDFVYGKTDKKTASLNGQCLHAKYISFSHPRDGREISVDSSLPDYFTDFLRKLRAI